MADEEIVIIEGDEDDELDSSQEKEEGQKGGKKKLILIFFISFFVILITLLILYLFLSKDDINLKSDFNSSKVSSKLLDLSISNDKTKSNVEFMIQKANLLYEEGNKEEALALFEEISSFSEAISYYNLGVAQMREKSFEEALKSFNKAIENEENRCVSAINAAVCANHLDEPKLFDYYLDLAYSYLPLESKAPLYSYYHGLIMYYKNQLFESLSGLEHPSSDFYKKEHATLKSKIYLTLNDNINSISAFEKFAKQEDKLALGLLYARIGEYKLAIDSIDEYMQLPVDELAGEMALALINLKLLKAKTANSSINRAYSKYDENATLKYPIKVILRDELFDINDAQKRFLGELKVKKNRVYDLFFYLAPFKVFDAEQTLNYIKKGNVNMFIDEIDDAKNIFKKSSTIAQVNIIISKAIGEILKGNLKKANKLFQSVILRYPNHSILHYNLALTYAQMGDYSSAYKYFIKSYHLNNKNLLSGVFSIMSANLTQKDTQRTQRAMQEEFGSNLNPDKKEKFLFALLNYASANVNGVIDWVETSEKDIKKPMELLLAFVALNKVNKNGEKYTKELKNILNNDVVVNILNQYAMHSDLDIKRFALKINQFLKRESLDLKQVLFGPEVSRHMYINLLKISGQLYPFKKQLEKMLIEGNYDKRGILQTLALVNLYMQDFESSFTLYNNLIDDFKQRDSRTIFLAAVAAVGSNHHENAIALLELSKIIDPANLEARYALGLLYQQIKNFKGASVQYQKVGDDQLVPDYFDFKIDK